MAHWLRDESPVFCADDHSACEDLAGELASVGYGLDSHGLLVIEDKESMRSASGIPQTSPMASAAPLPQIPIAMRGSGNARA